MTLRRTQLALLAGLAALSALFAAGSAQAAGGTVNIVAYSTPADAYAKIIPAFEKTPAGKGVKFTQSYGASGDQSRAVLAGQKADIVHFALAPDITRLVPKYVAPSWADTKNKGIVADSVVVFVVRKGNPKKIKNWADLIKPGVKIVTADPISSGGARWNALAAYGAALRGSNHNTQAAFGYLKAFFKNAPTRPSSARDALTLFSQGYGDVLVTYESEAIYANNHGENDDYVIPKQTILVQTPVALVKGASPAARAFYKFLFTPTAQKLFAKTGFRSVTPSLVDKKVYPKPGGLFSINNFGDWNTVGTQFFTAKTGLIAKAEAG